MFKNQFVIEVLINPLEQIIFFNYGFSITYLLVEYCGDKNVLLIKILLLN